MMNGGGVLVFVLIVVCVCVCMYVCGGGGGGGGDWDVMDIFFFTFFLEDVENLMLGISRSTLYQEERER